MLSRKVSVLMMLALALLVGAAARLTVIGQTQTSAPADPKRDKEVCERGQIADAMLACPRILSNPIYSTHDRAVAAIDYARMLQKQGDVQHAISVIEQGITAYPKWDLLHSIAGDLRHDLGDLDGALASYARAEQLRDTPNLMYDQRVRLSKAKILLLKNERGEAESLLEKIIAAEAGHREQTYTAQEARSLLDKLNGKTGIAASIGKFDTMVFGRRVALVVGVGKYRHAGSLPNPLNDAREVSKALVRNDFKVVPVEDPTGKQLHEKIRDFASLLQGADIGLFYFAGHGLQVNGRNFLLPIDSRLKDVSDLEVETIPLDRVVQQMERSGAKVNVLIIDACRDNPFSRSLGGARSGTVGRGLATMTAEGGTVIVFSTQPDNVALDGAGRNSPFAEALLRHIERPGLDISLMLRLVRREVVQQTAGKQRPWEHSSLVPVHGERGIFLKQ